MTRIKKSNRIYNICFKGNYIYRQKLIVSYWLQILEQEKTRKRKLNVIYITVVHEYY